MMLLLALAKKWPGRKAAPMAAAAAAAPAVRTHDGSASDPAAACAVTNASSRRISGSIHTRAYTGSVPAPPPLLLLLLLSER